MSAWACKGKDIGGREHGNVQKKITSERAAFNDLIFGGILGADLKDKAFAKLCDSLVLKKKTCVMAWTMWKVEIASGFDEYVSFLSTFRSVAL